MTTEVKERRQHIISLPRALWEALRVEAEVRGLTVGEIARSIVRCWADEKPMPMRRAPVGEVAVQVLAPIEFHPRVDQVPGEPMVRHEMTVDEVRRQFPDTKVTTIPAAVTRGPSTIVVTVPQSKVSHPVGTSVRNAALVSRIPDPPEPVKLPDPDFDAEALIGSRHDDGGVPF